MKNYHNKHIKVSVFMPVYNSSNFLDDSIQSILNQSHSNFELIIIDDGSKDNSIAIIESYAKRDKRIIFKTREHKGLPITRNEGIELASGKYFVPMDSDDISFSERLSTQIAFMEKKMNIVASGAYMVSLNDQGNKIHRHPKDHETIKIKLLFGSALNHPCSIIRLDTLKKHNIKYLESDTFAHDYRLWVSLSRVGILANIDKILGEYRQHKHQVSQEKKHIQYAIAKSIISSQLTELSIDHTQEELDILSLDNKRDMSLMPRDDTQYILKTTQSVGNSVGKD